MGLSWRTAPEGGLYAESVRPTVGVGPEFIRDGEGEESHGQETYARAFCEGD